MKYFKLKADLPIQPGQTVIIRKGARVWTTHPQGPYLTKKNYKVKVFDVSVGFEERKDEVTWVGKGSYWFHVDMEDCQKEASAQPIGEGR